MIKDKIITLLKEDVDSTVKELADIYEKQGEKATTDRLNQIAKEQKFKDYHMIMLKDKLKKELVKRVGKYKPK